MKLENDYALPASPEVVWQALNDPEVLRATLPGCKALTMVDERHFEATIQVRVGPVSATFRGKVELSDLQPQRGYTLTGSGNAGAVGFAKVTARVRLQPQGDGTLLHYDADVDIGGKLMSVGSRLIQSVSAQNLEAFFSALRAHVAGDGEPSDARMPGAEAVAQPATGASVSTPRQIGAVRTSAEPDWKLWFVGAASVLGGLVVGFLAGHFW